jgi:DNA-binding transcriptional regulator PaaX
MPKITKIQNLRKMLEKPAGASIDALCQATGWQAQSVRAAVTGLRKAGYTVERDPAQNGGSVYRITAAPGATQ